MKKTLLLLEFRSIGRGIFYLDEILKNYNVKIERAGLICPGKYLIVCSGAHGEIVSLDEHIESLKEKLEDKDVIKILVSGVNLKILEKVNKSLNIKEKKVESLGVLEFSNSVKAIEIADFLEDESPVEVMTIRVGVGMFDKGVVLFIGDTSAVKNVVIKIKESREKSLISGEIINSPTKNFLENLKI